MTVAMLVQFNKNMIQLLKCIVIYTIFIGIKLIYLYWKFSDRFIELLKDCFHSLNLLLPFGFRFLAILIYESAILFEVWFQCIYQSNFIHLLNQFSLYPIIPFQRLSIYIIIAYFEGILPKGPYRPCVSMAGRALLAGYHRFYLLSYRDDYFISIQHCSMYIWKHFLQSTKWQHSDCSDSDKETLCYSKSIQVISRDDNFIETKP